MKYIGLQTQISRNNFRSILLLIGFPLLILIEVYIFIFIIYENNFEVTNVVFLEKTPLIIIGVAIWFIICFFFHSKMIQNATNSKPLERKENMRVYNLTENLCMSVGMRMPKLFIIESDVLNAYASGISEKSYAVTLTRGIIDELNDKELEGVIAHELTHIRNRDVRLLIISVVFVGIFAIIIEVIIRSITRGNSRKNNKDGGGLFILLIIAYIIYFISKLLKLALSRKREYMADAGAVEMTKNSLALASALRKISGNSDLKAKNEEVKEMFIAYNGSEFASLFSTHPPIEKRIEILEQF